MAGLWYYTQNGQQQGPITEGDLRQLAATGGLRPTELVWTEGMASWTTLASVPDLFPTGRLPQSECEPTASASRDNYWREPEPRRPSVILQPAEDYDPEPRRRRKQGMGVGCVLALVGGGLLLLIVVAAVGTFVMIQLSQPTYVPEATHFWSLKTNEKATYYIYLKAGRRVNMEVKSNGPSDVDLLVFDGQVKIVSDEDSSPDCFVNFVPTTSKTYRVEVWNRLVNPVPGQQVHNEPNSGTFHYRQ
jgi:hypothetical protein